MNNYFVFAFVICIVSNRSTQPAHNGYAVVPSDKHNRLHQSHACNAKPVAHAFPVIWYQPQFAHLPAQLTKHIQIHVQEQNSQEKPKLYITHFSLPCVKSASVKKNLHDNFFMHSSGKQQKKFTPNEYAKKNKELLILAKIELDVLKEQLKYARADAKKPEAKKHGYAEFLRYSSKMRVEPIGEPYLVYRGQRHSPAK